MKKTKIAEKVHTSNLNNGITLIALVITIIILLILAGVAISSLNGENGLFQQVKLAKQKYSISEAKEKLELKITELRVEEEGKGETLTKEDLSKLNNDEIDVGSVENFPVQVIYGMYKFNVDEKFVVTYVGEANQTIITYTTDPVGYTNQDKVQILIKVSNQKGIKEIIYPDGDKLTVDGEKERGTDYTVTANGTYQFKVIDIDNNIVTKDIFIDNIDKLKPLDFTPKYEEVTVDGFTIVANAKDSEATEESSKSGIGKYEYYIDGTKYESEEEKYTITGLDKGTQYTVYVIAYDKAGNPKTSSNIQITTYTNPAPPSAKLTFNENNATKEVLDYPILTLDGMMNCSLEPNIGENVTLEITSKSSEKLKNYYSLDGGTTWTEYTGVVNTSYVGEDLIKVKAIYDNSTESDIKIVKKYLKDLNENCVGARPLGNSTYDNDYNTYQVLNPGELWINVDSDCWNKYSSIYCQETGSISGYGYISFYSGYYSGQLKGDYIMGFTDTSILNLQTQSILIPNNCYWICLTSGTNTEDVYFNVYEVWCSEEDLTGTVY